MLSPDGRRYGVSSVACLLDEFRLCLANWLIWLNQRHLIPVIDWALSVGAGLGQGQPNLWTQAVVPSSWRIPPCPAKPVLNLCLGVHGALLKEWALGPMLTSATTTDPGELRRLCRSGSIVEPGLGLQGQETYRDAACASSLYALYLHVRSCAAVRQMRS